MLTPSFARSQRAALLGFYISCLVFGTAVGLFEQLSGFFRLSILALAILATAYGAFSLYRFFKATDEFRMAVHRQAIEFAFIGSLVVSAQLRSICESDMNVERAFLEFVLDEFNHFSAEATILPSPSLAS
jgi:hypothetical protein